MTLSHRDFAADVAVVYDGGSAAGHGSGRLVAPGLILTAEHVISRAAPAVSPSGWKILLLGDKGEQKAWGQPYDAQCVWRGNEDLDIALLRILPSDSRPELPKPVLPPTFVRYELAKQIAEVYAVGFPDAWGTTSSTRDFNVPGSLWISSQGHPYSWIVTSPPDMPVGWKGMSGAAVCHLDSQDRLYLFGVVQEVPANFSHGQLQVARISKAFDDAGFRGVLGSAFGHDISLHTYAAEAYGKHRAPLSPTHKRGPLAALSNGIGGNELTGVEQFLEEYLLRPHAPLRFLGRRDEQTALSNWLTGQDSNNYFLVFGPAGRGKSALLTKWAAQIAVAGMFAVVIVPISIRFALSRGADLAKLWLQRLRYLSGEQTAPAASVEFWIDEIHRHLTTDRAVEDGGLVIIVDGVDEATDPDWFRFPRRLGNGVRVLVSSRILAGELSAEDVARRIGLPQGVPSMELPTLTREDLVEVQAVLRTLPEASDRLWRLTGGDPLLVKLYLDWFSDQINQSGQVPEFDPEPEQTGLARYTRMWWEQVERVSGIAIAGQVKQFLNVLSLALGPLMIEDIDGAARVDAFSIKSAQKSLSRILIGDGKNVGYTFSHPRLAQYFAEDLMTAPQRQAVEAQLVDYCRTAARLIGTRVIQPGEVSRYVLSFCIEHFSRARLPAKEHADLLEEGWMRAWHERDGHYGGYAAVVRKVKSLARAESQLRLNIRGALIQSTIIGLSDAIPVELLCEALDERLVTGAQAVELIRLIADPWARAVAIAEVSSRLTTADTVTALEVADQIMEIDSRLLAIAGLAGHLPPSIKDSVAADALRLAIQGTPLSALLARTIAKKTGGTVQNASMQLEAIAVDEFLGGWIRGDMTAYHRRIAQIIPLLHRDDREEFARMVVRARLHRDYRYDEAEFAQQLINAIVNFAPSDLLPTLYELLERSPNNKERTRQKLAYREEALSLNMAEVSAAKRREMTPADMAALQAHVKARWTTSRQIADGLLLNEFAAQALPLLNSANRSTIADRFAKLIAINEHQSDSEAVARVGLSVSPEWVSRFRELLGKSLALNVIFSPRLAREERWMLLREMLSHTHLKIEDQRALAICLNALDGEERADLSERILERIEGSSGDWAHNRNSSLLRAELIEAFAPPVVGSLGDQALRRIEAIIPRIKSAPDRALALATLALSAPSSTAPKLAWAAFVESARTDDQRHRTADLAPIAHLLPEDPSGFIAASGSPGERAGKLLLSLRDESRISVQERARRIVESQNFAKLDELWSDMFRDSFEPRWAMGHVMVSLKALARIDGPKVAALWSKGLDLASELARPNLIQYLQFTLPLLPVLLSTEDFAAVVSDVADIASWSWQ